MIKRTLFILSITAVVFLFTSCDQYSKKPAASPNKGNCNATMQQQQNGQCAMHQCCACNNVQDITKYQNCQSKQQKGQCKQYNSQQKMQQTCNACQPECKNYQY